MIELLIEILRRKQMLVPYRNSVLTSIFRPFFVGRGRTIICCNVNPCAAFVTQTNDLLKFCALAQKVCRGIILDRMECFS